MRRISCLLTALLGLSTGCVRVLDNAGCPCVSGYVCCEEQNVCRPEGQGCADPACDAATASCADLQDAASSDAPRSDAASSDAASSDAAPSCNGSAPTCPGGPFSFAHLDTPSATLQALVGRWQLCENSGLRWGPPGANAGIEFTRDGKYHLLLLDANGALQRAVGLHATGKYRGGEGEWTDLNVYFQFPEGGGASVFPSFDDSRTHMLAGGDSGFYSSYVRVPDGADNVPGVATLSQCTNLLDAGTSGDGGLTSLPDAAPSCDGVATTCPGGPFSFAHLDTPSATQQTLVGRWQLCESSGLRWGPPGANAGIEFTRDGTYHLLRLDPNAALQRVVGLHATGKYSVGLGSDVDLNVYFEFPEGGGASIFPSFDVSQAHMLAGGDSGFNSSYVRVPDGAEHVPGVAAPSVCGSPGNPWMPGSTGGGAG